MNGTFVKEWFRRISKTKTFYISIGFTLLSGCGSIYQMVNETKDEKRRHEAIFKDIERYQVRREENGFKRLSDSELLERYGEDLMKEYVDWKERMGEKLNQLHKKYRSQILVSKDLL